jgi:hypothetical protein
MEADVDSVRLHIAGPAEDGLRFALFRHRSFEA